MFNTILLPVDISSEASWKKALPAAQRLLESGGQLHVLTVFPDITMVSNYFPTGFEDDAVKDLAQKMKDWAAEHAPEAMPHVAHGRVYEEITTVADRIGADTIVMASHRPDMTDFLLGPNAARVTRHAKQSVFVVRD